MTGGRLCPVKHRAFREISEVARLERYVWYTTSQYLCRRDDMPCLCLPECHAQRKPAATRLKLTPLPALQHMPIGMPLHKFVPFCALPYQAKLIRASAERNG